MTVQYMEESWLLAAARNADSSKGFVVLENPETRAYLDALLIKRFWPSILQNLKNSHYQYFPDNEPEIQSSLGHIFQRSITFMLFDERSAFFRGKLNVSLESWTIESEFFLGLARNNDPKLVFEILGDSRFAGNPPTLVVAKRHGDYFQISFHNGSGAGWVTHSEGEIKIKLNEVIKANTQLYDFSKTRFISENDLGEFLNLAYTIYEAY